MTKYQLRKKNAKKTLVGSVIMVENEEQARLVFVGSYNLPEDSFDENYIIEVVPERPDTGDPLPGAV